MFSHLSIATTLFMMLCLSCNHAPPTAQAAIAPAHSEPKFVPGDRVLVDFDPLVYQSIATVDSSGVLDLRTLNVKVKINGQDRTQLASDIRTALKGESYFANQSLNVTHLSRALGQWHFFVGHGGDEVIADIPTDHVIAAGDKLGIHHAPRVGSESETFEVVRIPPEGILRIPLLQTKVVGMTGKQVTEWIRDRYTRGALDPEELRFDLTLEPESTPLIKIPEAQ